jgi:hypothetical protein
MKYLKILIPAFGLIFLFSCTSTQVVSSYKDESAPAKQYKKILVLGLFQQKERSVKQETEKELADRLTGLGYTAITAMDEYGPKAFEKIAEDQITEKVKADGYDAVITTAVLDTKKEERYQPGNVRYQPVGVYYNRFGRYYSTVYNKIYDPGYYTESTNYFLETNMYDVKSGNLVYSVQTKAFDPSSTKNMAGDNSKTIVKDMTEKGILIKK